MSDTSKYDRSVELQCPACGGNQFEHGEHDNAAPITCTGCGLVISRDDLIQANGENISINVDDVAKEVMDDLSKQLRQAFKGLKGITFK
ncbi:MAG: hypothetical protein QM769_04955 [Pseudoxanthomonas sp.]